jgi:hypothetical protein
MDEPCHYFSLSRSIEISLSKVYKSLMTVEAAYSTLAELKYHWGVKICRRCIMEVKCGPSILPLKAEKIILFEIGLWNSK